ncbi:MAG: serine--tRNA ligase [Candidatus Zixiibacteriota bacterium]
MLSIHEIRENPEKIKEACKAKREPDKVDLILNLDKKRREIIQEVEQIKRKRNKISKKIGKMMSVDRAKAEEMKKEAGEYSQRVKKLDAELSEVEAEMNAFMHYIPNVPHHSVPIGGEEDNVIVRHELEKKQFDFDVLDHVTLMNALDIIDMPRAAKMTGSFFSMLKGDGAKLSRALINFMLDIHTNEHGFGEIAPPFLANRESMKNTGQIPKLESDMYEISEDGFFLIPTAEVVLTNYHADEMLAEKDLPIKLAGYTPCFRREAGAYGADTKGLMRLHQFDKVELVLFTKPEESYDMHEKLCSYAEEVLKRLGLHYRVLLLASGDLSFAAAKCYDLEVYVPTGPKHWLEVSSCSNFEDFQARRSNIRYRHGSDKPEFVHTLNASGLALPRLIIAIIENFQTPDGRIIIPEALRPYFGKDEIK